MSWHDVCRRGLLCACGVAWRRALCVGVLYCVVYAAMRWGAVCCVHGVACCVILCNFVCCCFYMLVCAVLCAVVCVDITYALVCAIVRCYFVLCVVR